MPNVRARIAPCLMTIVALGLPPSALRAQTDFYNTDRGRPLTVEDAIAIERRAFELQLVPLTIEPIKRASSHWVIAPELAWGVLPRTQVGIAFPVVMEDDPALARPLIGLAGVEVELLHQLNAETMSLPAIALGADVHLRAGPLAPARAVSTLRALATRTFGWGRLHLNAAYAPGEALAPTDPTGADASRWSAGLALDHTFVLRSLLLGADVVARAPLIDNSRTEWRTGIGLRQQATPRLALDMGLRRRVSSGPPSWGLTAGAAYSFAPRGMPGFRGFRGAAQ